MLEKKTRMKPNLHTEPKALGCNEPVHSSYCSRCGQPVPLRRIDWRYFTQEIGAFSFTNNRMVYTIRKVVLTPGNSVRHFLTKDRNRFVNPITFLIITSLIYAFVGNLFWIDAQNFRLVQMDINASSPNENGQTIYPTLRLLINWMINYRGYTSIMSGFFAALLVKLFFRRSNYNLFEIFALLCFLSGISSLFFSIVFVAQGVTSVNLLNISSIIVMVYSVWGIGQFFGEKKANNYLKAGVSYLIGILTLGALVVLTAIFIDSVF